MVTSCGSNGFYIVNKQCMYYGKRISNPPKFNYKNINLTTTDSKIYLNGYEYFPKQDSLIVSIVIVGFFNEQKEYLVSLQYSTNNLINVFIL